MRVGDGTHRGERRDGDGGRGADARDLVGGLDAEERAQQRRRVDEGRGGQYRTEQRVRARGHAVDADTAPRRATRERRAAARRGPRDSRSWAVRHTDAVLRTTTPAGVNCRVPGQPEPALTGERAHVTIAAEDERVEAVGPHHREALVEPRHSAAASSVAGRERRR